MFYYFRKKSLKKMMNEAHAVDDDYDKVFIVARWVKNNTRYTRDKKNRDFWQSAHTTLRRGRGDCEDICILIYEILLALGILDDNMAFEMGKQGTTGEGHCIFVYYNPGKDANHLWFDNGAYFDNGTLPTSRNRGIIGRKYTLRADGLSIGSTHLIQRYQWHHWQELGRQWQDEHSMTKLTAIQEWKDANQVD